MYVVVNFIEMKRHNSSNEDGAGKIARHPARALREDDTSNEEAGNIDGNLERVARTPELPKVTGNGTKSHAQGQLEHTPEVKGKSNGLGDKEKHHLDEIMAMMEKMMKGNEDLQVRIGQLEEKCFNKSPQPPIYRKSSQSGNKMASSNKVKQGNARSNQTQNNRNCFRCGQLGHFIHECPFSGVMGQPQVTAHTDMMHQSDGPSHSYHSPQQVNKGFSHSETGGPVRNGSSMPMQEN